jgi:release factor glutamine methyltransferase
VRQDERFDIIVSNPPYIAEAERPMLAPEVLDWEPAAALFAPDNGLRVLRAIVLEAPVHLEPGGLVAVEVGLGQAQAVAQMAREHGGYHDVRVAKDLNGRDRIVLAERN